MKRNTLTMCRFQEDYLDGYLIEIPCQFMLSFSIDFVDVTRTKQRRLDATSPYWYPTAISDEYDTYKLNHP